MAQGTTPWKRLSGELAHSAGREFERRSLPLLRLHWPALIQSGAQDRYDNSGIDLFVPADSSHFSCVVQCKGFVADETLTASHLRQITDSIESFRASKFTCDRYILVHNRDRDTRGIREKVAASLASLEQEGKAKCAEVWGRDQYLKWSAEKLETLLVSKISEATEKLHEQRSGMFRFGSVVVPNVPFAEQAVRFQRGRQPHLADLGGDRTTGLVNSILGAPGRKWTFLVGHFGTGKTTAVLQAALKRKTEIVYVRCEDLSFEGGQGTNLILRSCIQTTSFLEDVPSADRVLVEDLAGPILRIMLSRHGNPFVLVLDGLDEHRFLATPRGLVGLANMLRELQCPIVLTTREEHFRTCVAELGDFADDISQKGSQQGRLITLRMWSNDQISAFLAQAQQLATEEERPIVRAIGDSYTHGRPLGWPAEFMSHPLFLQMVLEEAVEGQLPSRSRAALITAWVTRKIRRDISVGRPLPGELTDSHQFVADAFELMCQAAGAMVERRPQGLVLRENLTGQELVNLAASVFGGSGRPSLPAILGVTVLVPLGFRVDGRDVRIRFAFKIFQEFFTAQWALRNQVPIGQLPDDAQGLAAELASLSSPGCG